MLKVLLQTIRSIFFFFLDHGDVLHQHEGPHDPGPLLHPKPCRNSRGMDQSLEQILQDFTKPEIEWPHWPSTPGSSIQTKEFSDTDSLFDQNLGCSRWAWQVCSPDQLKRFSKPNLIYSWLFKKHFISGFLEVNPQLFLFHFGSKMRKPPNVGGVTAGAFWCHMLRPPVTRADLGLIGIKYCNYIKNSDNRRRKKQSYLCESVKIL